MEQTIIVEKLDAAKRQLETAIRLYFSNGDPISIHTLAGAAYNIVRDVNKKRGGSPMFVKDEALRYAKPASQEMLWQRLNEAENFFKHGDRDHNATTEFNPGLTDFHLWDACAHYLKLTGESPPLFQIYLGWFMLNNEAIFDIPPHLAKHLQKGSLYLKLGRATYFNEMLPLAMRS